MNNTESTDPAELLETPRPIVLPGGANTAAAAILEKPQEPLWYVAYGSNLYSSVFKGRRGIKALDERHVLVEGLELTFDLPGLPYVEPRFANCRLVPQAGTYGDLDDEKKRTRGCDIEEICADCNMPWTGKGALIGVAYLVTSDDFARVVKSEGGGSGYKMVAVEGKVFKRKESIGNYEESCVLSGETIQGFTLLAPVERTRRRAGRPSLRYLSLIRRGAEEHRLPQSYRDYLDSIAPYIATTFRQKLGAAIAVGLCAPPMIALVVLGLVFARKDGTCPTWVKKARVILMESIWSAYDNWKGLFGDGEKAEHDKVVNTSHSD